MNTSIPDATKQALSNSLKMLQENPRHQVEPFQRLTIYKSFDPLIDISGDLYADLANPHQFVMPNNYRPYASLAILTTKHILSLWDQAIPAMLTRDNTLPQKLPQRILEIASGVLNQTFDADE